MTMAEWIERLRAELGNGPQLELTSEEERLVLDLARISAHSSERIAAPLTTFLAGVALAELPRAEREERLRQLVETLS